MDDFVKINEKTNITVIVNMHHVDLALKYAKRVIGINKGVIVFDGPCESVDEVCLETGVWTIFRRGRTDGSVDTCHTLKIYSIPNLLF
ncbi:hypothetical protein MGH68_11250 [Erysipelothrix sp. D19-032]